MSNIVDLFIGSAAAADLSDAPALGEVAATEGGNFVDSFLTSGGRQPPPPRRVIDHALEQNPDEITKRRKAAETLGVPTEVVDGDPEFSQRTAQASQILDKLAQAPATARFLQSPGNADISIDSVDQMVAAEIAASRLAPAENMADKGWATRLGEALERGQLVTQLGREGYRAASGTSDPERLKALQERAKALGEDNENDFIGWLSAAAKTVGQQYETMTSTTGIATVLGGAIAGAGMGATAGAVGGPLAALTAAGGALTGGAAGMAAHFARESMEIEGGHAYLEQREMGIPHDVAKWSALGVGIVNAGLEMAGATVLLKPVSDTAKAIFKTGVREAMRSPTVLAAAKRAAGAYGSGIAAEVTTEALQELVNVAGEEVSKLFSEGEFEELKAEDVAARVGDIMVQTFKSSVFLAAPGPAGRFAVERHRIKKAEENQAALDSTVKEVMSSPLAERDPAKAAEAMAEAMDEAGVSDVFIPAERIVELAQAEGVAPYNIFAALNISPEAATEAIERGGDVRIDSRTFAERIGTTGAYATLTDHIRVGEGGLTPAEAKEYAESDLKDQVRQHEEDSVIVLPEIKVEIKVEGQAELTPEETQQLTDAGFSAEEMAALGVDDARALLTDPDAVEVETVAEAVTGPVQGPVYIAEEQMGLRALFRTAAEAGMTQTEYAAYLKAVAARTDQAEKQRRLAIEVQNKREATTAWKAERLVVENEVTETVNNTPVYQALLGIGRDRLDRDAVAATLPPGEKLADWEARLPKLQGRSILAAKSETATIDPDTYAQLHGYPDAVFMLQDFMTSGHPRDAIKAETDRIMLERHGDLNNRIQAAQAAIEYLHSDVGARAIEMEMNAARKAAGLGRTNPRLIKHAARERMAQHKVKDIQPVRYIEAERRAAAKAGKLLRSGQRDAKGKTVDPNATGSGNRGLAARMKFQQLLNFYYAHLAYKEKAQIAKDEAYLRQFTNENKKWVGIDEAYITAIREVLGGYQLGPALSERNKDMRAWKAMFDALDSGTEYVMPPAITNADGKTHYSELTLEQWRGVVEAVKTLYKQGKDYEKFIKAEAAQTRTEAVNAVAAEIRANLTNKAVLEPGLVAERIKQFGRSAVSFLMNDETVARLIDGGKALGTAYQLLVRPFNQAYTEGYLPGQIGYKRREEKAGADLVKLWNHYTRKERSNLQKMINVPGVARPISRQGLIATLLNMGNDYNRQVMIAAGQFTADELQAIQQFASKKDLLFAQKVWDYLESYWQEISDTTYRRDGFRPKKVDAAPMVTQHGTFRGGYYPVMYEGQAGKPPDVNSLMAQLKTGGFVSSHTANGHTKEREGPTKNPVSLLPHSLSFHVKRVIYDLEVGDAIRDTYKVLMDKRLVTAFRDQGQQQLWETLHLNFGDKVTGEIQRSNAAEAALRWARVGFTVSKIGFNLGTVASQPLGIVATMAHVGKTNTMVGLAHYLASPLKMTRMVTQSSGFMQGREDSFNADIAKATRMISEGFVSKKLPARTGEMLMWAAFVGMRKLQKVVDTISWLAAKRDGLTKFDNEAQANEYADRAVARAQGSGNFGDRTAIERGTLSSTIRQSEFVRMFTPLMSYFIAKNNVAIERSAAYRRSLKGKGAVNAFVQTVDFAADMALLFVVEAVVLAWARGQLPEEDDDDKSTLGAIAGEVGASLIAGIPVVREIASVAKGYSGSSIPIADFLARGTKAFMGVAAAALDEDKDFETPAFKEVMNFLGYTLRLPAAQINRVAGLMQRSEDGEEIRPLELVFGPRPLD